MQQLISNALQLLPLRFDKMVFIKQTDAAAKKEELFYALRSFIRSEHRIYTKAKKLKRFGPTFIHERCITIVFDRPSPEYAKVITYRLHFGPDGVIVAPASTRPDPEVAPFLEPVNLSQGKNEFFDPADFEPRRRKLIPALVARPTNNPPAAAINQQASIISIPEARLITVCCAPSTNQEGDNLPYLRFGGGYLKKFGFKIGSRVNILLEQNRITIINADEREAGRQLA